MNYGTQEVKGTDYISVGECKPKTEMEAICDVLSNEVERLYRVRDTLCEKVSKLRGEHLKNVEGEQAKPAPCNGILGLIREKLNTVSTLNTSIDGYLADLNSLI